MKSFCYGFLIITTIVLIERLINFGGLTTLSYISIRGLIGRRLLIFGIVVGIGGIGIIIIFILILITTTTGTTTMIIPITTTTTTTD